MATAIEQNLFEEKAQLILAYLKRHVRYDHGFLPRPFFIELTGSPSAGKTTTVTEMDKFMRRQGFRVLRPQEGAEVIRHIERTTPLYNIRTGLYALNLLLDISAGHTYDLVIFDRGIYDAYCWMMYWLEKGLLSEEEKQLIQQFFLSRFWRDKIDAAYFFVCDPEVAMEREMRIALSKKMGETTNPETIRTLVNRYKRAYELLRPEHIQLVLMDTTHMDEQAMVEETAYHALSILEKKTRENSP
jgi:thymidylate kinase